MNGAFPTEIAIRPMRFPPFGPKYPSAELYHGLKRTYMGSAAC